MDNKADTTDGHRGGSDDASNTGAPRADQRAGTSAPRNARTGVTKRQRSTHRRQSIVSQRRVATRVFRLALSLLLIIGGAVGIAAFRLSRGTISLSVFKGSIESAIAAELGGNSFFVRDAELALGSEGLEIALLDIRISGPSGTALVQSPRAVVGLSGAAALRGQLGFSRLDLVSPRLQFFYAEDGTLSLKFAQQSDGSASGASDTASAAAVADPAAAAAQVPGAGSETAGTIDFVKAMTDISAQARRREHVTAYMREIGLKQLTLVIDNGRRKTIWRVPEVKLDLSHKTNRSFIEGRATIDSLTGPWTLDFQTAEVAGSDQLVVQATVNGVNPRGLSRQILSLAPFERVDVPLDGTARLDLSSKGSVNAASFALAARPGRILAGTVRGDAGQVEAASIKGEYSGAKSQFTFSEASLSVDRNRLDLTGTITRAATPAADGLPVWNFDTAATGGFLAPVEAAAGPTPIREFRARGQLVLEARRASITELILAAGGASVVAKGSIADVGTDASHELEARIAPMPLRQMLALWPSTLAPDARAWLSAHLSKGQLNSGVIKLASVGDTRLSMTLDVANAEISGVAGLPPLIAPRGLVRLEGGGLEFTVPDATLGVEGKRLLLKGLRLTVVETVDGTSPTAEMAFRLLGPLTAAFDLADREPFRFLKARGITFGATEGKLDGQFKLTLPLSESIQASDVRVEGRLRVTDARIRQAIGPHDVTGGKFDVEFSDTAIDGRGDFLFKGIPVKVAGQHFLNTSADRQSPVKFILKLDDNDRSQLGLDVVDLVTGEIPVEITVGPDLKGEYQTRVDADLTRAELTIESVAFRKQAGAPARLQFDVAKGAVGRTELRNFKIAGDTIAAEGFIVLGADGRAKEISFPSFSLNTVSRLEVQGLLRPDQVWDVKAKGATFDGREVFRDLFNFQHQTKTAGKDKAGLDLSAEFDTVIGFNETNLKTVRLKLQKRIEGGAEKTTALEVTALHETGKPFEARIRNVRGERSLIATSQDAGQTFKAIGFYPNAGGGDMNLEVTLDGRGSGERNGTLKADRFFVLGDPIISEVYQNNDSGSNASPAARGPRKKVVRERFEFDWMVLPFSVGCGQFVMNDVEIRGPLVGARMRGKADFKSQRLQIGGTYIPLSGLNSAIGGVPVLGQILAGPKGEGIFGITFAIQGQMANPDVLVNPLSGIVPGILRETQQLTPDSYKITPCSDRVVPFSRPDAARSSSAAPAAAGSGPAVSPRAARPDVITDWSSDARGPRQK